MVKKKITESFLKFKHKLMTMDKNRLITILLIALGVLLIAAIITVVVTWGKGYYAGQRADRLLSSYEREIAAAGSNENYSSAEINQNPQAIEGYLVMGRLEIEAIEQSLPVIERISDEALRVSVCLFSGSHPGQPGNLVITGHNFASGAHFGRLDELESGDVVTLTLSDGTVYMYEVYESVIIAPDDLDALNIYRGERALSLITCVYNGNRRLLVRCKAIDN